MILDLTQLFSCWEAILLKCWVLQRRWITPEGLWGHAGARKFHEGNPERWVQLTNQGHKSFPGRTTEWAKDWKKMEAGCFEGAGEERVEGNHTPDSLPLGELTLFRLLHVKVQCSPLLGGCYGYFSLQGWTACPPEFPKETSISQSGGGWEI